MEKGELLREIDFDPDVEGARSPSHHDALSPSSTSSSTSSS